MNRPVVPSQNEQRIHATTVARGAAAAIIRGPSGVGKSDLALRFLSYRGAWPSPAAEHALVADDQTILRRDQTQLIASSPLGIAARLEVRGVGIVEVPHRATAQVRIVIDLVAPGDIERFPLTTQTASWLGITVPVMRISPFEVSAPLKLMLLLDQSR
jgi:HPr kinase/phosphorylase